MRVGISNDKRPVNALRIGISLLLLGQGQNGTEMALPRSETDPNIHSRVDEALKRFKVASKRIQLAAAAFAEEGRLLERLYYKSKNQHRSALFFQRIEQVRRIARRITAQNLPLLVDGFRNAFYQEVPKR